MFSQVIVFLLEVDGIVSPFVDRSAFAAIRLIENTDPNGLDMEFEDERGTVFARVAKVYKKGGLFGLFNQDNRVQGEVRDAERNLLLTTSSYRRETKRDCKLEIHNPDGALFGSLYDAHWGADFELPDGTPVGKARRPVRPDREPASEPTEVVHAFIDASEEVVGTCDRHYPSRSQEKRDVIWELLTLSVCAKSVEYAP